jgi:hypothetical protein
MVADARLPPVMPWLSLPDYARRTGTPESTVRAAIRKGTLEGHQEQRAPGDPRVVWKVWVDDPQAPAEHHPQQQPQPSSDSIEGHPPAAAETAATEPPAVTMRLLDTVLTQAETIAALRERVGRSEAARAAAERRAADLAERLAGVERERDQLREAAERPWWQFWRDA